MVKVIPYRKSEKSTLDVYRFASTASIVDLTDFKKYSDSELSMTLPEITEELSLDIALKILDGQIRKVSKNMPDISELATVAKTGNYSDLKGLPTIPSKTSQLANDSGYLTNVTWDTVTGKPSTFKPSTHNHGAGEIKGLSKVATSGNYIDLIGSPKIPENVSDLNNDSGFLSSVSWSTVTGKPSSFTPSAHNQASSTITAMTGYAKPSTAGAIVATDTLNGAIGKLEKGLDSKLANNGNAVSASKLLNKRTIRVSGAVTGSVEFDGSTNATINTTLSNFDASKITSGTIDIARLPKAAVSELVTVVDDGARFKLTKSQVQNGDTVKVTSTEKMYYVVDDTQLSTEAGYESYSASTDWGSITSKPSSFTPSAHTHTTDNISGLSTVATSGKYTDLTGLPTIPTKTSQLSNDSGFLSSVSWSTVTGKPSSFTPSAHNQASSTITAMTGYVKPSAAGAITATDTLNGAIGKLEKGLEAKMTIGSTADKATADAIGQTISTTYIKGLTVSGKVITYTKGDGSTGTITTQDTNTTYGAATSSVLGLVKTGSNITNTSGTISLTKANVIAALGYTPPTTNTTYGAATTSTLGLVKTGANITNTSGTISLTKANVTAALGYTPPTTNTTYSAATNTTLGLVKIGDNITNTNGTISLASSDVIGGLGYEPCSKSSFDAFHEEMQRVWADKVDIGTTVEKSYGDEKGQNITKTYIKGLSVSGRTVTYTRGDGTTGTITTQDTNTTYGNMTAATASAAGRAGLVPAPPAGAQAKCLTGAGTWVSIPTGTIPTKLSQLTNDANYAKKTDIPSVWDSSGHLVSPSGWKMWVAD